MQLIVPPPPPTARGTAGLPAPTTADQGRVTHVVPSDATTVPTIVVAGAPRSGKSSVVNAVLGGPALAPVTGAALVTIPRPAGHPAVPVASGRPGAGTPGVERPAAGGAPVIRPLTSAYLSFRYGASPAASSYVPGHKGPRPMAVDDLADGDLAALTRGSGGRPARRIDVRHPSAVLRHVTLVDTPGAGGFDQAYTEIVLEALRAGAALLFVTDAAAALQPDQLDLLAAVEQVSVPVTFVLTKIDGYPQWPAVLSANQTLVHDHAPRLATAPWYAVSTLHGTDNLPPAGLEEAARGLAGLGVAALREGLTGPPAEPEPAAAPTPAPRVVAEGTDAAWMQVLDRAVRARAGSVSQRLAIDLATIHVTCVQDTTREHGCGRLAHVFDRELHALSIRATRAVEEAADDVIQNVFERILDARPYGPVLARIRRTVRRALVTGDDPPEWDRILLVTATSGVAVTAGRGAVASLSAVPPRPLDEALLPPIGVALSAGCYAMWRPTNDRKECRGWLQQAVRVLETTLDREVTVRFDQLRVAVAAVAADAVDHGVLLA